MEKCLGDTLLCHLFKSGADIFLVSKIFKKTPSLDSGDISSKFVRYAFNQSDFLRVLGWALSGEVIDLFNNKELKVLLNVIENAGKAKNPNYNFEKLLYRVKRKVLSASGDVFNFNLCLSKRSLFLIRAAEFEIITASIFSKSSFIQLVEDKVFTKKEAILIAYTVIGGENCCAGFLSEVTGVSVDYCSWCLSKLRRSGLEMADSCDYALIILARGLNNGWTCASLKNQLCIAG
ncbi:hypothetical protein [Photobacterium kishitanii]|uniref:hypothetical protein n=1 Tax=Photobacterium kishitanii TaxID=318456 RepID=UPI0011B24886|nr:hypothetical protein [Photobacterium kishitanii]